MAFFKEAPIKGVTRNRDTAKANVDRLALKLIEAEQAVIATRSAAQVAALSGNDAALDAAEASEGAAHRRHATIVAAHAEARKLLTTLDQQIATMTDQKTRTATAGEITALADDLMQAGESFEIANVELVKLAEKAARIVYEAKGLEIYTASSRIEVPVAIQIISELLREYGRSVINGSVPATLPAKEVPFVAPVVTNPATRHLFALRAITWKEGDLVRVAQKFTDVDLPLAVAKRALKAKACCEINDPLRNPQTVNQWGGGHPEPANCFNLDSEPPEPRAVVQHSAFEIVDRGPSYLARVS